MGEEKLLGKQLLLSAWELITDSPAPGKVMKAPHRNWRGQVKSKEGSEESKGTEKAQLQRVN